jgi:hypothetical protein
MIHAHLAAATTPIRSSSSRSGKRPGAGAVGLEDLTGSLLLRATVGIQRRPDRVRAEYCRKAALVTPKPKIGDAHRRNSHHGPQVAAPNW